jgi:diacylglycerol O-acyltransferase
VQPIPINDSMWLFAESRQTPMHVGGMVLLEPPADAPPDWMAQRYQESLLHADVDARLARRPVRIGGAGPWEWQVDENVDLEYHVRHSALPHPGRIRELLTLVGRLHGSLLDRSRPLWETHLIEGLANGQAAIYTKLHHALVDGISAMRLLERSMSTDPDTMPVPAMWTPRPRRPEAPREPSRRDALPGPLGSVAGAVSDVVSGAVEGVRAVTGASEATLKSVVRSFQEQAAAMPFQAPRSVLNVPITGARRFAAESWSLERLAAVRRATGATLNDVLMAMSAGALRRYLDDLGALPDDPLVAMVPVSLRAEGDDSLHNAVGLVLCNLGTHLADPEHRFAWVRRSMEEGKMQLRGLTPTAALLVSALSISPLALGPLYRFEAFQRPPFNLVISNVPGPREQLWWHGAKVLGDYPLSIPTHGQAMNITATTVSGDLDVGITGDRNSLPHLQDLLGHLETSLAELEQVAGVP